MPPVTRLLTTVVAGLTLTQAPIHAQDRRPMTTDDGLDLVTIEGALMSPDGDWVLYATSTLKWNDNKRVTTYRMVSADSGEAWQYISDSSAANPSFSPDGSRLAFTRAVEKKAQLFVMRTQGGEAVQLTRHKTAVGRYRWAPDGYAIFFVAEDARPDSVQKQIDKGADAFFVDEGPNGQTASGWSNLWVVGVDSGDEHQITKEEFRITGFDVGLERRVVATIRFENRRNQSNLTEIFLVDPGTGARARLTNNRAPEGGVQWAPDGRQIVYSAPSDAEWDLRLDRLWVMDTDSREPRMVSGAFSGNISNVTWTADSRALLFNGLQRTNTNLFRLDVGTGRLEQLTEVDGTLRALAFSRDRTRMVYSFQDFDTPPDLYTSPTDHRDPTRLTRLNPSVETDLALAPMELVKWKSTDGLEIEGLVAFPSDYHPGTPAPLLLHIHGGPAGVFTNSFRYNYHVWAGLGYVQLMPNVRGSSGYTDDLLRGNMADLGGGDYQDLMTGVDHLIATGVADSNQLGLRGWSYGGILGGWTVTQTERFKAASIGAMVSDWTSEYGPGFNFDVRNWYLGDTPWENPEFWRERSALTHVGKVTTPTLILHGMNDRTDTEPQSMMFFQALRDQGKTVRYVRFPREPHGFREPRHQRRRDIEEISWIQKYVRNIDWTPWVRPPADSTKASTTVTTPTSEGRHP